MQVGSCFVAFCIVCVCVNVDVDGNCPFLPVSQVSYREHSAPITHCKFSPNATQVASVDTDGRMRSDIATHTRSTYILGSFSVCLHVYRRVWDPSKCSTTATTELTSSLLSFDWVPQLENLVRLCSL